MGKSASLLCRPLIRRLLGAARLTTMRMQQPIPSASKLASGLAPDPQHSPLAPLGGVWGGEIRWGRGASEALL
jgi:hypothetical protein